MTLLYTAREARAKLGIKTTKFYQLLSDGQLEGRKLGTRLMITGESLRAFVDSLPRADIHMAPRKIADSGDRKWDGAAAGRQPAENVGLKAAACSAMAHRNRGRGEPWTMKAKPSATTRGGLGNCQLQDSD